MSILCTGILIDAILSPSCYRGKLHNSKSFNSFQELCYLHPDFYSPNSQIFKLFGINQKDPYIVIRFVSWEASHDFGHSGFDLKSKIGMIEQLSKYGRVFISSESKLPEELKRFQLDVEPHLIHDVLSFASLFIESTMASECCMLGTPAIYINSLEVGTINEQKNKYNLVLDAIV